MIRHNEHSLVALVIEMVPSARNAIGQSLKQLWKTLSHLELYHAALKFGCISFDDKETNWLFNTRLTQPWPQSQRHVPQVFQEVTAHAELGRIALYFQKKVECNVMPMFAQWKVIREVIWLSVPGENRPALPCELVTIILKHLGLNFILVQPV